MKSYVVGGAVRDRLLGLPVVDRDHVVVGATVDEMLAAGFRPVGRDFPVFLHPVTHEEYALARTERKVAPGYAGFVFHADPSVSLEADLERRDLTINAIAEDEASGCLVDPFGGQRDLASRLFRHVGPAFVEDPVRLLRVARFAARFVDFGIADETLALMRRMTQAGEVDALVPERVWQEVSRGLMERRPSRMLAVLSTTGALARVLPEIDPAAVPDGMVPPPAIEQTEAVRALDRAAAGEAALDVRFAVLVFSTASRGWDVAEAAIRDLCRRMAVPAAARDLALLVARERDGLVRTMTPGTDEPAVEVAAIASALVTTMDRSDGFRRAARFAQALDAIAWTIDADAVRDRFVATVRPAVAAACSVDAGAVAREVAYDPPRIATRLREVRSTAVEAALR